MKAILFILIVISPLLCSAKELNADTYAAFETTKYFSENRYYFVEVNEKNEMRLYRDGKRPRLIWHTEIAQPPRELYVSNAGNRVFIIDHYYGNQHNPETNVILIFNEKGVEMANYTLGAVANFSRLAMTTSHATWFEKAWFDSNDELFIIQTIVPKLDWDECLDRYGRDDIEKCWEMIPYEQLVISTTDGKIVTRRSLLEKQSTPNTSLQPTRLITGKLKGRTISCFRAPVRNILFYFESDQGKREFSSDKDGNFEIDLPAGIYRIYVDKIHGWMPLKRAFICETFNCQFDRESPYCIY